MNTQREDEQITIITEKLWESIVRDIVSVLTYAGLFWVNMKYLGNTWFLQIIFGLVILIFSFKYASNKIKRFDTRKDAVKFLFNGKEVYSSTSGLYKGILYAIAYYSYEQEKIIHEWVSINLSQKKSERLEKFAHKIWKQIDDLNKKLS